VVREPFLTHLATAVPIEGVDVNTDQILPGRFMKRKREDYGQYLFYDLRHDSNGARTTVFPLDWKCHNGASILVCDHNFGCGSSREQAVHTLVDHGIRAVIAPSVGEIFSNNCAKNGLVVVILPDEAVATLRQAIQQEPHRPIWIDLPAQITGLSQGPHFSFEFAPFAKECLTRGLDEIELTMSYLADIESFEARQAAPTSHTLL
jgi:3-isopropylmalate/(R)-2-methylmalate dehydratase small subunit